MMSSLTFVIIALAYCLQIDAAEQIEEEEIVEQRLALSAGTDTLLYLFSNGLPNYASLHVSLSLQDVQEQSGRAKEKEKGTSSC